METNISPKIKGYLDRLATSEKKPQSFLFVGSDGAGKEDAAFYFIAKMAGKSSSRDFFEKMAAKSHPDVVVIEPETEEKKGKKREKEIEIGQVREAKEKLKYFSYELGKKFCLVKRANRMSQKSANAFLKVLEEPQKETFFIVLATDLDTVLPTIVSRCAVLRFPSTDGNLKNTVLNPKKNQAAGKLSQKDLEKIVFWSGGRIKVAEEMIKRKELLLEKEGHRERLRHIFSKDLFEAFDFFERESKDRIRLTEMLKNWEIVLEGSLRELMKESGSESSASRAADKKKIEKVTSWLFFLRNTINRIETTNANPRTAVESLVLSMKY